MKSRRHKVAKVAARRTKRNGKKEDLPRREKVLSFVNERLAEDEKKSVRRLAIKNLQRVHFVDDLARKIYLLLCKWSFPDLLPPEMDRNRVRLDSPVPSSRGYTMEQIGDYLRMTGDPHSKEIIDEAVYLARADGGIDCTPDGVYWYPIRPTFPDDSPSEPHTQSERPRYLGDSRIKIGEDVILLEEAPRKVIEALLDGPLTKDQLVKRSGVEDAVKILRRLKVRYPHLAPFIVLPGSRGKGGYRVNFSKA